MIPAAPAKAYLCRTGVGRRAALLRLFSSAFKCFLELGQQGLSFPCLLRLRLQTVTLVECALQLLAAHPAARLLLCAPQNYSADLLCSALAEAGVPKTSMLRLNDPRRPAPQVRFGADQ